MNCVTLRNLDLIIYPRFGFQEHVGIFFWTNIVFFFIILFQIYCPAIVIQMIYSELEAIKIELHNQLMVDRGKTKLFFVFFSTATANTISGSSVVAAIKDRVISQKNGKILKIRSARNQKLLQMLGKRNSFFFINKKYHICTLML